MYSLDQLKPEQKSEILSPDYKAIDPSHPPRPLSESQNLRTRGVKIVDPDLIASLDKHSIEDVVELKISRFLDQIGGFYPDNVHELIMTKVERPLLKQILRRVGGNQVQASKVLGINRNTLRKKMKLYGLL